MVKQAPTIYRYEVPVDDQWHTLELSGAILHVAARRPEVVELWAFESGGPRMRREFRVFGTGQPMPEEIDVHMHRGTALADGPRRRARPDPARHSRRPPRRGPYPRSYRRGSDMSQHLRGSRTAVRFDGTPPAVQAGDPIEIQSYDGTWWPACARSEPRYDWQRAIGRRCYLTVAVDGRAPYRWAGPVNWPAEHVRPASTFTGEDTDARP